MNSNQIYIHKNALSKDFTPFCVENLFDLIAVRLRGNSSTSWLVARLTQQHPKNSKKLNSRPVYCSRLYGMLFLSKHVAFQDPPSLKFHNRTDNRVQILTLNLEYLKLCHFDDLLLIFSNLYANLLVLKILPFDWMSTGATAVTKPPAEDLRDKISPSFFSTNGSLLLTTIRLELDAARSWFFPFSIFKRNFKKDKKHIRYV